MSSEKPIPAEDAATYPVPLASHQDVVNDQTLFFNTLRTFHFSFGATKFQTPVIGGKELNLHVLYVEVTRRGGYDKVVEEKKWREISSVFDLSPTTTSASYALRRHYSSLLRRYEQVYYFRTQPSMLNNTNTNTGPCSFQFQAEGTIDAKFDYGYLVSLKLGNETLSGVLYHPSYADAAAGAGTSLVPYAPLPSGRRSRKRRSGDLGRPKPNRSGYNFFFAEKHAELKSLYPKREREFTKMIGHSWNALSTEERVVYQNQGIKDKERYQKELKEYREKLKMQPSI